MIIAKRQPTPLGLLDELQTSLARGTVARRVELLRRVTDLFVHGAADYSDEQISLFDDVFACLVLKIHDQARIVLAHRLAPISSAPPKIIQQLALDELIEVAAPVLAQSHALDNETLIAAAQSRSQNHLLAISSRRTLSGVVTDVLVARGNDDVVRAIAINPDAELSDRGLSTLVVRADGCDWIATCLASRPMMPRHHYLQLVSKASEAVRAQLLTSYPHTSEAIIRTIDELAERARQAPAALSERSAIAHRLVRSLYDDGRLDDTQVAHFADAAQFDEVSASLACLARVPLALAEIMLVEAHDEGLFILGKVAELTWPTVCAIIAMRPNQARTADDSDAGREAYERLHSATAHQALRFHQMQLSTRAL